MMMTIGVTFFVLLILACVIMAVLDFMVGFKKLGWLMVGCAILNTLNLLMITGVFNG